MIPLRRVASLAAFGSMLVFSIVACSSSDQVTIAKLGSGCLIDSDCNTPLVCAFKTCHEQCTTPEAGATPDCPANELCVASDRPYHVCQAIQACGLNSDCIAPLVCGRDLECRDQCDSARDCVTGQDCIDGTCVAPSDPHLVDGGLVAVMTTSVDASTLGESCTLNSDCPETQVCRNAICSVQCREDRDCASGERCAANLCLPIVQSTDDAGESDATVTTMDATTAPLDAGIDATLMDSGTSSSDIPDGAPDGYSAACTYTSQCAALDTSLVCRNGACVFACLNDFDCNSGQCCAPWHACVSGSICSMVFGTDAGDAGIDAAHTDSGGADAGRTCGRDLDCQDGVYCNGTERCVNGACAAAAFAACDDGNACTSDACNEAQKSCSHTDIGPQDLDHDGHYAKSCGGTADDCDDTNADVHPGATEVCNFVDDNCDGQTDEGLWTASTPITLATTFNYDGTPDGPSMMRLSDGSFVVAWPQETCNDSQIAVKVPAAFNASTNFVEVGANYQCGYGGDSFGISIAGDGTHLLFGGLVRDTNNPPGYQVTLGLSGNDLGGNIRTDLAFGNNAQPGVFNTPAIGWLPARNRFTAAWVDDQAGLPNATTTIFTAFIAADLTVSSVRQLLPNQSDVAVPYGGSAIGIASSARASRVQLSVGSSSVLVAWTLASTGQVRWVIFNDTMTSVIGGPIDATGADTVIPMDVVFNGTTYDLLTSSADLTQVRVHSIDAQSGADLASQPVNSGGASLVHISRIGPGVAISAPFGTHIRYGWALGSMVAPFTYSDISPVNGGNLNGVAIAGIDATHAALSWTEVRGGVTVSAGQVACGL